MATAIRDGITTAYTYNEANQPVGESHSGGALDGLSIARTYDSSLRLATLDALGPGGSIQLVGYTYDSAGRLDQVRNTNSINHTARYTYEPNSRLIRSVAFTNNASGKGMLTTRTWDRLNRLGTIHSQAHLSATSPGLGLGHTYTYNAANQRTRADLADGSYWVYEYDKLGQVISGRRYWGDGTLMAGQDFTYQFDDIGNRDTTGGRASAVSDYSANQLNQYETRTVPNKLDILGVANPTQPVEVWKDSDSPSTASRSGEYFHHALTVAYSSYPEVRAKSLFVPNQQASAGRSFVPPAIEDFDHDLDGNLIKDGRWTAYVWDGENRLIEMKRDTATPTEARQRLTFEYDHLGRRVRKRFFTHDGTEWSQQRVTTYLYDGWNVVAELDGNNANATLRTYVWGTDLSGNRTGAGGVGGLLWVNNSQATGGLPTGIQFVAYDGNGNVSGLTSATEGSNTARYEYGPFGEPLRTTGPLAAANPIRWSTKVTDDETGLVYYGYRYYSPGTGRWFGKDPLGEFGSMNLYAVVANATPNAIDILGLSTFFELAPDGTEIKVEYFGHHKFPQEMIRELLRCGQIDKEAAWVLAGGDPSALLTAPDHNSTRHGTKSGYNAAVQWEFEKWLELREKYYKSLGQECRCIAPINKTEALGFIKWIDDTPNPLIRVFNANVGLGPKKLAEKVDEMRSLLGPNAGLPPNRNIVTLARCISKGVKCIGVAAAAWAPFLSHAGDAKIAEQVTQQTGSVAAGAGMYIYLKTPLGEVNSLVNDAYQGVLDWDRNWCTPVMRFRIDRNDVISSPDK
jgi:RHS repeat-associated protein